MKKREVDHVLRAVGRMTVKKQFIIVGSQAFAVDIYAVTIGQLGALYVFVRYDLSTVVTDLGNGALLKSLADFGRTLYDLVLPHYGYYGGAGWGVSKITNRGGAPQSGRCCKLSTRYCMRPDEWM